MRARSWQGEPNDERAEREIERELEERAYLDAERRCEEARALGFPSAEQCELHARWLRENGTSEFKQWLAQREGDAS